MLWFGTCLNLSMKCSASVQWSSHMLTQSHTYIHIINFAVTHIMNKDEQCTWKII